MTGPHISITPASPQERFTLELLDSLWDRYRNRVSYAAVYESLVQEAGGTFLNDHIAFRTIASQQPATGIISIARIAEALGYRGAGWYQFEDQHLSAAHFQHPNAQFPKLFISELRAWELTAVARGAIVRTLSSYRGPLPEEVLAALTALAIPDATAPAGLREQLVAYFTELPWELPEQSDVELLNRESQYGAWVLVHGFNVNHFTALVNAQGVAGLADIEKTVGALQRAGVPMKAQIEGEPGSRLRQTATEAVVTDVPVKNQGRPANVPWPYAYFEIAERGQITDPATGTSTRFEGFLGAQAANLFQMTRAQRR